MFMSLIGSVGSFFCDHEWTKRSESGHLYLECLKCLATTRGIQIEVRTSPAAHSTHSVSVDDLPSSRLAA